MVNYLIDSHCHLHDTEWFTPEQAEQFLAAAQRAGVRQIVVIGADTEDSTNAQRFALRHNDVYWTYGIHPESAERYAEDFPRAEILDFCHQYSDKLVAIGEIGLDYHYEGYSRVKQIKLFEQMLQVAQDLNLPVSLHIREAFADAWAVMDNFPKIAGVVHSFTGNKRELCQALERGFYIGVNGLVTYTTPPLAPLERILLETDAPFLTPVPFRGTMNKPEYVRNIAAYLAEKLGVAEVKITERTTENARQLFKMADPDC